MIQGVRRSTTLLRKDPQLRALHTTATLNSVKRSVALPVRYSYEEFADHVKAMRMVREWEYTSRFGHLGSSQTSRANSSRVVEYFSDSYANQREALDKADVFLSIYDYIGRNATFFARKALLETCENGVFSVDSGLLRAVHHLFTVAVSPDTVDPKHVVVLAKAFSGIEQAA